MIYISKDERQQVKQTLEDRGHSLFFLGVILPPLLFGLFLSVIRWKQIILTTTPSLYNQIKPLFALVAAVSLLTLGMQLGITLYHIQKDRKQGETNELTQQTLERLANTILLLPAIFTLGTFALYLYIPLTI